MSVAADGEPGCALLKRFQFCFCTAVEKSPGYTPNRGVRGIRITASGGRARGVVCEAPYSVHSLEICKEYVSLVANA